MRKFIQNTCLAIMLFWSIGLVAQTDEKTKFRPVNTGIEFQWYPAGIMPGLASDWTLTPKLTLNTRIGMNIADRKDWGEHDNEEGSGFGGSIGLRRYMNWEYEGLFFGLRTDIWNMRIDWIRNKPFETGFTDILILQPTAEIGYLYPISEKWKVGGTVALGFEINVVTEGEAVGQGRISLLGALITRTF